MKLVAFLGAKSQTIFEIPFTRTAKFTAFSFWKFMKVPLWGHGALTDTLVVLGCKVDLGKIVTRLVKFLTVRGARSSGHTFTRQAEPGRQFVTIQPSNYIIFGPTLQSAHGGAIGFMDSKHLVLGK